MSTLDPQELGIRLEAMRMGLNEAESSEAAVQAAQQYYDFLTDGSQAPSEETQQLEKDNVYFQDGWNAALWEMRNINEAYKGTGNAYAKMQQFLDDQLNKQIAAQLTEQREEF